MKSSSKSCLVTAVIVVLLLALCGAGAFRWLSSMRKPADVARISHTDPALQEAVKTARATLPQFYARLRKPEAGDRFAVKGRFKTAVGPEYLWLKDPKIVGHQIKGTLDQNPIALTAHRGQLLTVAEPDVFDWLVKRADGSQAGAFTEIALTPQKP